MFTGTDCLEPGIIKKMELLERILFEVKEYAIAGSG